MAEAARIGDAKIEDVLFDQMEFLLSTRVDHLDKKTGICDCDDCMRFNRVRDILMEPFGEKVEAPARSHQKKARKAAG